MNSSAGVAHTPVGATVQQHGVHFRIWAPGADRLDILLRDEAGKETPHDLTPDDGGWFSGVVEAAHAGSRYRLRLNGEAAYPDPYSRSQPDGVHGTSEIVAADSFRWSDAAWRGRSLEEVVIYELHVGTATREGTFDALIERLPYFADLGINTLEIMPVAEFPGARNWGYDGTYLFAPSRAYGGPAAMRRFIDAAHAHDLAVILDVVYNHFGPEGNYLPAVTGGRIFTQKHNTPWGAAVNYDDAGSDAVRTIVLDNVRQWVRDYHVDGLRLDATHAIMDGSDTHILQEITAAAKAAAERPISVIAEDERNERRLVMPVEDGGYGLDAVWADDAHHSLRRLVAGDNEGYYAAYEGTVPELTRTLREGWLYQGEPYAPTGEPRGTRPDGLPPRSFVHCIQNHDQVGNRALGERLNHQVDPAVYRAVSALLLLTPYTPLLWMGQEWAATTPFLYFTDHPAELGRLVTEGRRAEFSGFAQFSDEAVRERIPDPQHSDTLERSRLRWDELDRHPHAGTLAFYRELLRLRRDHPALQQRTRDAFSVQQLSDTALALRRSGAGTALVLIVNVRGELSMDIAGTGLLDANEWRLTFWSEADRFGGAGTRAALEGTRLSVPTPGAALLEAARS